MLLADSSGQSAILSTATLQVIIGILTVIIKIGKYLPFIVFATSALSLMLAMLNFAVWGNVPFGVLNTIFAIGGFVFLGQLLQKRSIGRRKIVNEERHAEVNEPPVEQPMSMTLSSERQFKDQAVA